MVNLNGDTQLTLKYDPDFAIELPEKHLAVQPGYHKNRRQWNTITIGGSIPDALIPDWINHSYNFVNAN